MSRFVEMACSVFILRVVTAANMAADLADSEMYPGIADSETVLTARRAGCHILNHIPVFT
jgi:hypothetical protein